MSVSIQNSVIQGVLFSAAPLGGILLAPYLGQSPLIGAAGGLIASYAYLGNGGLLLGGLASGVGALYLGPYLMGEGFLGNVVGGVAGGTAYAYYDNSISRAGRAGIVQLE